MVLQGLFIWNISKNTRFICNISKKLIWTKPIIPTIRFVQVGNLRLSADWLHLQCSKIDQSCQACEDQRHAFRFSSTTTYVLALAHQTTQRSGKQNQTNSTSHSVPANLIDPINIHPYVKPNTAKTHTNRAKVLENILHRISLALPLLYTIPQRPTRTVNVNPSADRSHRTFTHAPKLGTPFATTNSR